MSVIPFPQPSARTADETPPHRLVRLLAARVPSPHPEWLRSAKSFRDLPRASEGPFEHAVTINFVDVDGIANRALYVITTCTGPWSMSPRGFEFAEATDAAALAARFPEQESSVTPFRRPKIA